MGDINKKIKKSQLEYGYLKIKQEQYYLYLANETKVYVRTGSFVFQTVHFNQFSTPKTNPNQKEKHRQWITLLICFCVSQAPQLHSLEQTAWKLTWCFSTRRCASKNWRSRRDVMPKKQVWRTNYPGCFLGRNATLSQNVSRYNK